MKLNNESIEQYLNELVGKDFLEAIGDGISIQDTNFKILYQNSKLKSIEGNHIGEYCYQAYEKGESECKSCPLAITFKDGFTHTSVRREVTNIGISYYEITSSPLKDKTGKIIAGIEVVRDITERRKVEEALKESEERYRLLFTSAPYGFAYHKIIVDENNKPIDYVFLDVNSAFEDLTGLKREDIINKKVTEALPGIGKDPSDWIGKYGEVALTGKVIKFENHSKGIGKWYSVTAFSYKKGYFTVVFDDITERKKAEDKLEQLNTELERSNKELEQFASVASHDLKSPLLAVSGFASLLKRRYKDKLDKNANEYIDSIVNSSIRMENLISALLMYSRIGVSDTELKPVDFNKVVVRAIANLKVDIEKNRAKITHDSFPTVIGDDVQLEQLLQNLVGNAIKYHSQESPRVHISVKQKDGNWVFSVKDNGIGIAAEDREKIFDMFHCLSSGNNKGTGIGLAICKKIVDFYGGKIWVESQLNTGSIFYFTMPITSVR